MNAQVPLTSEIVKPAELFKDVNYKKAWLMVFLCLGFSECAGAALDMVTSIMAPVLADLGKTPVWGASLASSVSLASMICSIPMGFLITRFGYRLGGIIGFAAFLCGAVLAAVSSTPELLIVARFIQGIGFVVPLILAPTIIATYFPKEKLGIPLGICGGYAGLGHVIMLQVANGVVPIWGWRGVFWVCAGITAVIAVLWLLLMRPGPAYALVLEERKRAAVEKKKASYGDVFKTPEVWALAAIMFAFTIAMKGFMPYSSMIFMENCGAAPVVANNLSSLFGAGMIFGGLLGGAVYTFAGKRRGYFFPIIVFISMTTLFIGFRLSSMGAAWTFAALGGLLTIATPALLYVTVPVFAPSPGAVAITVSFYTFFGQYFSAILAPYITALSKTFGGGGWQSASNSVAFFGIIGLACAFYIGYKLNQKVKNGEMV
ncbi:MAG: MFS transporter [Peptococcaceae bacterium]|nr:MFS transporter [Peptococcaceae bacterium]